MAADPLLTVAGSVADKQYVTYERNLDNSSTLLHLWSIGTDVPGLVDTVDIGNFTVYRCKENDSGTIGIYGTTSSGGYRILHPWLDGNSLSVHTVVLPASVSNWWVGMDGAEFVTQRTVSGIGISIEGYAVNGAGTPWSVVPYNRGMGSSYSQGYMLGVPSAGKFIWLDDRPPYRTVYPTYQHMTSQSSPGSDAYGSPEWDVTFTYVFPDLEPGEAVLQKDFSYGGGTFGYLQLAYTAYVTSYSPPWPPSGGTLHWGSQLLDADLSTPHGYKDFTPYYYGYPRYLATTSSSSFYAGADMSSVPDDGTFTLTFHTTPPYTGGVANGGWGGFVGNPYHWPPPYDGYYYAQDFYASMPLTMTVTNPHSKEIQLWGAHLTRPGGASGNVIDAVPLEGDLYLDSMGFPYAYVHPDSIWGPQQGLLGCGDSFYERSWRRWTYAGNTLVRHAPADITFPEMGRTWRLGVWKGQIAIVSHDYQPTSGG